MKSRESSEYNETKLPPGIKKEAEIIGVIGIMNIAGCNYLATILNAELIGNLYNARIFKVSEVTLIPFSEVRLLKIKSY